MVSSFFVKQKTAYEMRISDWSSDVCSSDLPGDQQDVKARISHTQPKDDVEHFQADYLGGGITVEPGKTAQNASRLFAGAKEVKLIDQIGRASCRERVCQYV